MPIFPSPKVLLVDPQPEAIIQALQHLPMELVIFNSGQEAIAKVATTEFALIILTETQSEWGALDIIKIFRSFPLANQTPIVFFAHQEIITKATAEIETLGTIDFLSQAFHLSLFSNKVKFYLDFFQQKQALEHQNDYLKSLVEVEQLENEFSSSERLNKIVLANISDAVFITNLSGDLTFISPNVHVIFGYSLPEVEAMDNIKTLLGEFNFNEYELKEKGEICNLVHDILDKQGKIHHLLVNVKKVAIDDGIYLYDCRDISELARTEQAIRNSEANFRDIFANISDGLLVLDQDDYICYANSQAVELLNRPLEELVDQIWSPEQNIELTLSRDDNTRYTFDVSLTEIKWYGKPAKLVSLRDITDRKCMENELRENQDKYYRLLENLDNGVVVHKANTEIIYANSKAEKFLGLTDLEGRNLDDKHWLFFDQEGEMLEKKDFPIAQVLAKQVPLKNFEMGFYRADLRQIFWAEVNAYPEFYNQNTIQEVIVTFADITERKQAEIQLKTINENLEILVEERTSELEASNRQLLQEIIEKEQVSVDLATQEAKYRALVRYASDAIILITVDFVILEVNHRAVDLIDYSQEELIGRSLQDFEFLPLEFYGQQRKFWRTLKRKKIAELTDVKVLKKTGELISVDISASVITYENHSIIQCIVHDITLQKNIQAQLQRENYFRQQLLEKMVEGLCVYQPIDEFPFLQFTVWNPIMEAITGYSQAEINQYGWYNTLYPDSQSQQRAIARMKGVIFGVDMIKEEWQIMRRDGALRTIEISTALIKSAKQTNVLALIHDVTEQKKQLQIIQDNEATLRCIVENLPIFFGMRTMDFSKWYYINPAFENLTGHTPQAMYSDPTLWQKFHRREESENLGQDSFSLGEWTVFSMEKEDGTEIWVQAIEFLVDDLSESARVVVFAQDITDTKRAEIEIRRSLIKERELNEAKSQFVDIVSHEFRTPLTSIVGFGELLSKYFDRLSPEKKLHYISNIQNASQRLKQLIDDVLSISRYDANKLEINLGNVNLWSLGNDLIEGFRCGLGSEHHLQFNYHLKPEELSLVDVKLLRHALENILSNAIKYSAPGSIVSLNINKQDNHLLFVVKDQGIGIPPQDQEKLFEAFHRASNVGDIPGTGLGLSIVKRYVEFQGGKVEVDSVEGQGTTIVIKIPLSPSFLASALQ
ncbi:MULTISPECIES: PAS domain S-box protein [unclassified Synechocystis]|uniref:hybrid sensor histidine kinase/response regulator n=1 Tax=unclassified Synechocystis TaxID=2640012 RepID=UPI000410138B|nr:MULTISPECIES: PAS domain S-box protein [unclassified Synechocystis]AIE73053.1 two-component hybrid sensor and regulator [Synechocystis sp. PCC 6714]MCT0254414.1 PAS domain S-box protein [Synechocystis sp. CS-94]